MSAVYVGDRVEIQVQLSVRDNSERVALLLHWRDGHGSREYCDVPVLKEAIFKTTGSKGITSQSSKQQSKVVSLFYPALSRGYLTLPRLTIESSYPLGLFRVWSHVALAVKPLVYPKPIAAGPLPFRRALGEREGQLSLSGDDDFAGHSPFQLGMPFTRVDWKLWARREQMFIKEFGSGSDERLWLDWEYLEGQDLELRLSHLCDWVLQASQLNLSVGLRLPGLELAPQRGDSQRLRLLQALALYRARSESDNNAS